MSADIPSKQTVAPEARDTHPSEGAPKTPPESLPIPAPPDTPPPPPHDDRTKPDTKEIREWGKFVVEVLTLAAVIWYACIASRQLTEMHDATIAAKQGADAAQKAVHVARDTLTSSNVSAANTLLEMQKQSKAMQDNVRDYQDATRKELQPYVFLQRMDLAEPILPNRLTPTVNSFINAGNTPAFNLQHLVHSQTVVGGTGPEFTFRVVTGSKGTIAPKGTFDGDIPIPPMTPTQVAQVYAGTRIVYVTGRITYTDVFNKRHQLEYCAMLTPQDGKMIACREQGKSY